MSRHGDKSASPLHRTARHLVVRSLNASATRGVLQFGSRLFPCALGRTGIAVLKREADGATPYGRFELREVFYNPAALRRPGTALPLRPIRKSDGWCDAPADRNYNRPVRLPYSANAESLWRADGLYDLVIVLDYNIAPRMRQRGSAIFMHVARPGFAPTEGCIALRRSDLLALLADIRPGLKVVTATK